MPKIKNKVIHEDYDAGNLKEINVKPTKKDYDTIKFVKSIIPDKKDRIVFYDSLQDELSINDRSLNDAIDKYAEIHKRSNNPKFTKSRGILNYMSNDYIPNYIRIPIINYQRIHLPKGMNFGDILAETSHAFQYNDSVAKDYGLIGKHDIFNNDAKYNTEGFNEFNAHKIIEPALYDYIVNETNDLNSLLSEYTAFPYNGKIYKSDKNYSMGGNSNLIKNGRPNIIRGGTAKQFAPGLFYMSGRTHAGGGIDIGKNPKTGVEVEDGEVVQLDRNGMRVFSAMPFLTGESPANLVASGADPDVVFAAQENFKDKFRINDDGTMAQTGGLYKPGTIYGRPVEKGLEIVSPEFDILTLGRLGINTVNNAVTDGITTTAKQRGLITARRYDRTTNKLKKDFNYWKDLLKKDFKEGNYKDIPLDLGAVINRGKRIINYNITTPGRFINNMLPKKYRPGYEATKETIKQNIVNLPAMVKLDDKNEKKMGGIHIDKNKRGTFTANASRWKKPAGGIVSINGNVKNGLIYTDRPKAKGGTAVGIDGRYYNGYIADIDKWIEYNKKLYKASGKKFDENAFRNQAIINNEYVGNPYQTTGIAPAVGTKITPKVMQQSRARIDRIFTNKAGKIGEKEFQQIKEAVNNYERASQTMPYLVEDVTAEPIIINYPKITPSPSSGQLVRVGSNSPIVGEDAISAVRQYDKAMRRKDVIGQRPTNPVYRPGIGSSQNLPATRERGFTISNNEKSNRLKQAIAAGSAIGGAGTVGGIGYVLTKSNDDNVQPSDNLDNSKVFVPNYNIDEDVNNFSNRITRIGNEIYPIESDLDKTLRNIDTEPIGEKETPFVQDRIILTPLTRTFNIAPKKVDLVRGKGFKKKLGGNVRQKAVFGEYEDWTLPIKLWSGDIDWYRNGQKRQNLVRNNNRNKQTTLLNVSNTITPNTVNVYGIGLDGKPVLQGTKEVPQWIGSGRDDTPLNVFDNFTNVNGRGVQNNLVTIGNRQLSTSPTIPATLPGVERVQASVQQTQPVPDTTGGSFDITDPAIIGAGANILGSIGSYLINRNILNKSEPKPTEVRLSAQKLRTNYNINPQLDELREQAAANNRLIANNTASSRTLLGRTNLINTALGRSRAELYGTKENKETELINQDILNSQSVRNQEAVYNAQLRADYQNRLDELNRLKLANNSAFFSGLTGGINSIVDSLLRQRYYNNTIGAIAARNPNVDARIFRDAGVDWRFMYPYSTRNRS